jgi:rod shape-determining protein MreC
MPKKYLSSQLFKLTLILTVCGLIIFLNPVQIFSPFRNLILTVARPFEKISYVLSRKTENTLEFFGSISRLHAENEKLLRENISLASEAASLREEKRENEFLREQLSLLPIKRFNLEACYVIGQDPQKLGSWIVVDKGQRDGIFPEMPVIISQNILIGKVSEVYFSSSKIDLLTNSSSSINVVDSSTGAKGIVRGEFGLGVMMDMVEQTDILNVGDDIATSGLGNGMPKGLLVGKIQEIGSSQDKLFQQALIIPSIKYSRLDAVFVIKNNR